MNKIISLLLVVSVFFSVSAAFAQVEIEQRAVLVTGASSGIGLKIAKVLAANGFYVYAGARKAEDLARLEAMENVSSIKLDVTVQEQIDAAADFVRAEGRGLYGVVNNAGVGVLSSLVDGPEDDIDFTFDVNVYGPYRVNKAFMPMLMESNGRTTTISSISGFIASGGAGAYSMSKFAVEAYTDSLAAQMDDNTVHVSSVQPGGYKSKFRERMTLHQLGGAAETDEEKASLQRSIERNDGLKEPDEVAAVVLRLMSSDKPRRRYMVTPNKEQADATIRAAMGRVIELNADQPYEYSREELIALIDDLQASVGAEVEE